MNTRNRKKNQLAYFCLLQTVVLLLTAAAGPVLAADNLDLANRPLLTGTSVKPNVMVAVDNSGSMDFEVLFPTADGQLYWHRNTQSFYKNGRYNPPYHNDVYAYLFPNGCNNGQNSGKRIYCDYDGKYAVPPIPQLAFARSPDYNKSYFDPADNYQPWLRHANAWQINGGLTAIPFDPAVNSRQNTIDLTAETEKNGNGDRFRLEAGMTIPAGTKYYHAKNSNYNFTNVCINTRSDNPSAGYYASWREIKNQRCYRYYRFNGRYYFYQFFALYSGPDGQQEKSFSSDNRDYTARHSQSYAISYFAATFYLNSATELPADYGYTGQTLSGKAPNGSDLVGYEIKRDNFSDQAHYLAAIHNFANWFTYYRKRHLAVRGGIVSAFDRISGVRAGSCTINNPQPLNMLNIDRPADRNQFYRDIFGINFDRSLGTPNRQAVDFLGQQLETNSHIIQSPCQKNYAILFTDGYNSGRPASFGRNRRFSGDLDGDGYANTMADIALHYYNNLGQLQFPNNISRNQLTTPPACDAPNHPASLDCEGDLHINLYGVTLGQSGTVFSGSGHNRNPYTNPPDWSRINSNDLSSATQIDDLWHATVNSHGALLNAQTPQDIADTFSGALENILNSPGSASSVATDSESVTANSISFNASYVSGVWNGELAAYRTRQPDTPIWKASTQFNKGRDNYIAPDERVILTSVDKRPNSANDNSYQPTAFEVDDLHNAFGNNLRDVMGPLLGTSQSLPQYEKALIQYIRGDRSKEQGKKNGTLRYRGNDILGDIVHSTPAYVGAPDRIRYPLTWKDKRYPDATMPENSNPYYKPGDAGAFAQKYADREPMVYVGANDGMLHGFDATTGNDGGQEKMAYVPGTLLSKLDELAEPDYKHRYYVDGSPATGDVFFNGAWHTVLVGGLGNGGRSIYALDITDPSQFSEDAPSKTVLWEYSDPGLGKTFGKPQIVRLHDGQWAAIFSNGYNSDAGDAALYVVNIENGHLITRIEADYGLAHTSSNGLSTPFPVDLDGDFVTDYAYAGDLYGNIWRFDLTSEDPNDWSATKLFTATGANGDRQPITTQPQARLHPYGRNYGVMVYFGTGKYIENSDAALNKKLHNSFYGVWDRGVFTFQEANNGDPLYTPATVSDITRAKLQQQRVIKTTDENGKTYRILSANPVDYQARVSADPGDLGWYIDLPKETGEIIDTSAQLQGDSVIFSTTIPNLMACVAGGSGYLMVADAASGGRTKFSVFDSNGQAGINADDRVTFENDDTAYMLSGILIKQGAPGKSRIAHDPDSGSSLISIPTSSGSVINLQGKFSDFTSGRMTWREIRR